MTSFTRKSKVVAATVTSLVALTGTVLSQSANAREVVQPGPALEAQVVRLGHVPNFWAADCPITLDSATAWAQGDDAEAAALQREGFTLGVRELLRSGSGETGVSVALQFHHAAEASADLERREQLAGRQGYATNFALFASPSVRAYTVRTADTTTVHVGFTRGEVEYELAIDAGPNTDVNALQRTVATAVTRVAGL